jgi:hypothetical protein
MAIHLPLQSNMISQTAYDVAPLAASGAIDIDIRYDGLQMAKPVPEDDGCNYDPCDERGFQSYQDDLDAGERNDAHS